MGSGWHLHHRFCDPVPVLVVLPGRILSYLTSFFIPDAMPSPTMAPRRISLPSSWDETGTHAVCETMQLVLVGIDTLVAITDIKRFPQGSRALFVRGGSCWVVAIAAKREHARALALARFLVIFLSRQLSVGWCTAPLIF